MDARIYVSTLIFGSFVAALLISALVARSTEVLALNVVMLATAWGVFIMAFSASIAMMLRKYSLAARMLRIATIGHVIFLMAFLVLTKSSGFDLLLFVYALSSTPYCALTAWKVQRAVNIRPSIKA